MTYMFLMSASDLLPHLSSVMSAAEAAMVGASSPTVPLKLAQYIWEQKYVWIEVLLPGKLGSEPTFFDSSGRLSQWSHAFIHNTYTAVMAKSRPDRFEDQC